MNPNHQPGPDPLDQTAQPVPTQPPEPIAPIPQPQQPTLTSPTSSTNPVFQPVVSQPKISSFDQPVSPATPALPVTELPHQPYPSTTPPTPTAPPTERFEPIMASSIVQPKSKKKLKLIIVLAIGLIFVAVATFAAFKFLNGGIKLKTYEDSNFSVLVPDGYEKKEQAGLTLFEENDPNEDTKSGVMLGLQSYGRTLTSDQKKTMIDLFEKGFSDRLDGILTGEEKLEDSNVKRTKVHNNDALEISGSISKNGTKEGTLKMVVVFTDNEFYLVGVAAHTSDPKLAKKTDAIINSFEAK